MPKAKFDLEFEILSPKLERAIEHYIDTRDANRAALMVGYDPREFRRLMRVQSVAARIQKKIDLLDHAMAEAAAKARILTVQFLDEHLMLAAKAGAEKGDIKAVELGYERIGMRRDGNFMTAAQSTDQTRPQIYRVLEHTVTRTEQVSERVVAGEVSIPAQSTPGQPTRLLRANADEIMEY